MMAKTVDAASLENLTECDLFSKKLLRFEPFILTLQGTRKHKFQAIASRNCAIVFSNF
jgi:hypothetical protein